MKRILCFLFTLLLLFAMALPFAALAEETTVVAAPDVNAGEPFTWAYLATIAGAAAFTLLFVQLFKVPLDRVWKIPTRVFVYIVALAILLIATAFTTGLTIENAPLAAVNAFLVALTAYGTYEVTFAKINK